MPESINEKQFLTTEEVFARLPDEEYVHTFRQARDGTLLGADWERREMIKAINKYQFEVTGKQAQSMGHGMAFCDEYGWVFVQTKPKPTQGGD